MSISVSYYLIFDIAKVINKVESCIFWTTFLLLKNIKSLIISGKENVLENFYKIPFSKTFKLLYINMLRHCVHCGSLLGVSCVV